MLTAGGLLRTLAAVGCLQTVSCWLLAADDWLRIHGTFAHTSRHTSPHTSPHSALCTLHTSTHTRGETLPMPDGQISRRCWQLRPNSSFLKVRRCSLSTSRRCWASPQPTISARKPTNQCTDATPMALRRSHPLIQHLGMQTGYYLVDPQSPGLDRLCGVGVHARADSCQVI